MPNSKGWQANNLVKIYGDNTVLKGVSISLKPGEVIGLVGHNGAGKSTLVKCLSGAIQPEAGELILDGEPVKFTSPQEAIRAGVSTVYQELALLSNLSLTENIFLGKEITRHGVLDKRAMQEEAQKLVDEFNLDVDVNKKLVHYPVATRQLLEIAVATHRKCKYLLLDEPTTALEAGQIDNVLELIRDLAKQRGIGIVFIDHKLSELYAVADRILALVDGRVVIDADASEVAQEDVIKAITGKEEIGTSNDYVGRASALSADIESATALQVEHLKSEAVDDVSFIAREGRILGIYGLVGAGRSETLRVIAGIDKMTGGKMTLFGDAYEPKRPIDAIKKQVAFVTEERKQDGIVPLMNSAENATLPILSNFTKGFYIDVRQMKQAGSELMDQVSVRGDRNAPVASLSGGNQQKVLLARALGQKPRLLLLDEPTKGVDIGVKTEIHAMLRSLAHDRGLSVVVVSSEEEEILALADDVVIFQNGTCDGMTRPVEDMSIAGLREAAWSTQ